MWQKIFDDTADTGSFGVIYKNDEDSILQKIYIEHSGNFICLQITTNNPATYWSTRELMRENGFHSAETNHSLSENTLIFDMPHSSSNENLVNILGIAASLDTSILNYAGALIVSVDRWQNNRQGLITNSSLRLKPSTLSEKIDAVKYSQDNLKKILDDLSDQLLDNMPPLDNEIDNACKLLVELFKNDPAFTKVFCDIFHDPFQKTKIKNIDDLKYHLCKARYYHHFMYENNDKYKYEHCQMAFTLLNQFAQVDLNDLLENKIDAINALRTRLIKRTPDRPWDESRTNLALLILAKYWPLNDEDPITLDAITPDNRVFTTSGHQFDLEALIENHELRPVKFKVNGVNFETANNKKLLHPITSHEFSDFDKEHIESVKNPKEARFNMVSELYDYMVIDAHEDLYRRIHGVNTAYDKIDVQRIARLDKPTRDRLVETILKHHRVKQWMGGKIDTNEFSSCLHGLMNRGLSIEMFTSFDTEKQEILTLSTPRAYYLIDQGVNAEKLFELSATSLKRLYSESGVVDKCYEKGPSTIDAINQLIEELGSAQSSSQYKLKI